MTAWRRSRPFPPAVLRAWARIAFALLVSQALLGLLGLGEAAAYAVMPAIFLALFQPNGPVRTRLQVIAIGTVLAAALAVAGGSLSGTGWLVLGLGVCGLLLGYAPRLGPHAAVLQLPLLTTFVCSVASPLDGSEAWRRGLAVLLALPVFLAATAWFAPREGRRPLVLGATRALVGLADALAAIATGGQPDTEGALAGFQASAAKVRASALSFSDAEQGRGLLALSRAVPAAALATLRLERTPDQAARRWARAASRQTRALAAALSGQGEVPGRLRHTAHPGVAAVDALTTALDQARDAIAVLRGVPETKGPEAREVSRGTLTVADPVFWPAVRLGLACLLVGALPVVFGIGGFFWAVFAAVLVLATPATLAPGRLPERLAGTLTGVVLAGLLVPLTDGPVLRQLLPALAFLLPGMLFMAVSYRWTCFFVAAAVGLLFGGAGDPADFFHFQLLENVAGCAVIVLAMALTWRDPAADPWPIAAARLLRRIGEAAGQPEPATRARALKEPLRALRDAAADRAAAPETPEVSAATWTVGSSAEHLAALVAAGEQVDPDRLDLLADRLLTGAPAPIPATPADPTDPAAFELDRLTGAVDLLARLRSSGTHDRRASGMRHSRS